MLLFVQYPHDVGFTVGVYVFCPGDELLAAPLAHEPMVRGHVFGHGGIPVPLPLSFMDGQAFVPVVYLDKTVGVDYPYLLADMPVGYAIVVLVLAKVDMAVLVDGALGIRPYLVTFNRKGPSSRRSTSSKSDCLEYSLPLKDMLLCTFKSSNMAVLISSFVWKVVLRNGANTLV